MTEKDYLKNLKNEFQNINLYKKLEDKLSPLESKSKKSNTIKEPKPDYTISIEPHLREARGRSGPYLPPPPARPHIPRDNVHQGSAEHGSHEWAIGDEIGFGGMGTVYVAEDETGRQAALKILQLRPNSSYSKGTTPDILFEREVQALKRLDHAAIPKLYDAFTMVDPVNGKGRRYVIVMEHKEGEPVQIESPLPAKEREAQAVNVLRQTLDALVHAHEIKVVHRNLTPQNILVSPQGRVSVIDFGVARMMDENMTSYTSVSDRFYTPPEVEIGGHDIDGRADLYSLAGVAVNMLRGKSAPIQLGSDELQDINPALRALLDKNTNPVAAHRSASAKSMLEELDSIKTEPYILTTQGKELSPLERKVNLAKMKKWGDRIAIGLGIAPVLTSLPGYYAFEGTPTEVLGRGLAILGFSVLSMVAASKLVKICLDDLEKW